MAQYSYQHQNLRGRSFRGQDLRSADFSQADIRGANFTNALLRQANFSQVRAGLSSFQFIGLGFTILIFFVLSGFITGYSTGAISSFLIGATAVSQYALPSSVIALLILTIFLVITVRQGLTLSGATAVTLAAISAALSAFASISVGTVNLLQSLAIAGIVAGVLYCAVATAATLALSSPKVLLVQGLVVLVMAALGILFAIPDADPQLFLPACAIALVLSLILEILGMYTGRLAWRGDPKYGLIRQVAIALTAQGTCFRGADLTDADFSGASLGNTDFRRARLLRTNWHQAEQLERAHREGTYLANDQIRRLVVTKDGHDQNFERQDLHGLNLAGATLADANLMKADLGAATLRGADLSRSQLVQTQLHEADLTEACLTGAYIQDWGISTSTQLAQVRCDYVYMQLPTKDDPDPCRKPDNRNEVFKENDFSDFMTPIIKTLHLYRQQHVDPREVAQTYKTLDLYHHEGIDPQAAAIALKALADQHPDANLQVVALEGRGQERIRLQAQVLGNVDRSELSAEYFEQYSRLKALPYGDIQALLAGMAEKDERIRSLETIVTNAIQSDRFYVETYYQLGDTVAEKNAPSISSGGGDVNYVGGDIRDVSGVVSLGQISGEVANIINQLPDAAPSKGPALKELLTQLQTAIETAAELPAEDKAEALEQVKTLAEAGQDTQAPPDGPLKKAAKTALKILKGTAAGLPDATKLVEEFNKLLPAIATLIGLL
ncbi:pentapeptide repeat-containing protein [Leptolyngbya sp. CCY15150]|uniref:pentapeptide repeat-containing protein n=1 Tax=Leptolyngbya sp. CCY15150 TaxID=2767772 RepID=UPI0023B3521F|nr:pentapeptide repeat-containing protein [Leptolyngbya sp. CCY15150]